MEMNVLIKYLIWIVLAVVGLTGIYKVLNNIGII